MGQGWDPGGGVIAGGVVAGGVIAGGVIAGGVPAAGGVVDVVGVVGAGVLVTGAGDPPS